MLDLADGGQASLVSGIFSEVDVDQLERDGDGIFPIGLIWRDPFEKADGLVEGVAAAKDRR